MRAQVSSSPKVQLAWSSVGRALRRFRAVQEFREPCSVSRCTKASFTDTAQTWCSPAGTWMEPQ